MNVKRQTLRKDKRSKFTLNYSNYDLSGGDLTVFTEFKANTYFGEQTPPPPFQPLCGYDSSYIHTVATVVGGTYWWSGQSGVLAAMIGDLTNRRLRRRKIPIKRSKTSKTCVWRGEAYQVLGIFSVRLFILNNIVKCACILKYKNLSYRNRLRLSRHFFYKCFNIFLLKNLHNIVDLLLFNRRWKVNLPASLFACFVCWQSACLPAWLPFCLSACHRPSADLSVSRSFCMFAI